MSNVTITINVVGNENCFKTLHRVVLSILIINIQIITTEYKIMLLKDDQDTSHILRKTE